MLTLLVTLALTQSVPSTETFPQLQDPQSADLGLATRFIEEHLISFQLNGFTGVELRQGMTVFKIGDSMVDAMRLVPEAAQLARLADEDFRNARICTIVGLSLTVVGLGVEIAGAFIAVGGAFPVLMLVGAGIVVLGLVAILIGLPFSISYQTHLFQSVNTFNTGLVRGVRSGAAAPAEPLPAAPAAPGVMRDSAPALLQLATF